MVAINQADFSNNLHIFFTYFWCCCSRRYPALRNSHGPNTFLQVMIIAINSAYKFFLLQVIIFVFVRALFIDLRQLLLIIEEFVFNNENVLGREDPAQFSSRGPSPRLPRARDVPVAVDTCTLPSKCWREEG